MGNFNYMWEGTFVLVLNLLRVSAGDYAFSDSGRVRIAMIITCDCTDVIVTKVIAAGIPTSTLELLSQYQLLFGQGRSLLQNRKHITL
jgi:hypothetical protein